MIRRILLPTDGSAFSQRAADYALELAKKLNATIVSVHIVRMSAPKSLDTKNIESEAARRAKTCFESVKSKAKEAGIEVETKVLISRSVREALLEEIEEYNYDLTVMGAHGLSGVKKFILGSVSDAVVRHASKPVLLVK
jgi:nucleotide-binding universal stress UspA family protein